MKTKKINRTESILTIDKSFELKVEINESKLKATSMLQLLENKLKINYNYGKSK